MEQEIIIRTITAVAGILTGVFALIRYIIKANQKIQKDFLNHLEQKNGHTERIAQRFDQNIDRLYPVLTELKTQLARSNDQFVNMTSVLDTATRTIQNCNNKK